MMSQASLVADVLADLRGHFSAEKHYFPKQRDEVITRLLAPLKDAPPDAAVEFVLAGLRTIREESSTWLAHALNHAVASVLRRKLGFTEDQLLEMIGLVSVPHREFPF